MKQAKARSVLLRSNKWLGIGFDGVGAATALDEHCCWALALTKTRALVHMPPGGRNRRDDVG
jgi:hypothetical protein